MFKDGSKSRTEKGGSLRIFKAYNNSSVNTLERKGQMSHVTRAGLICPCSFNAHGSFSLCSFLFFFNGAVMIEN